MSHVPQKTNDTWGTLQNLDVIDGKENVQVKADIPGLNKKDLRVSIDGHILTIQGEKIYDREEREAGFIRTERNYSSFQRTLTLPQTVDPKKASASYKNGVLELTVPKK